MKKTLILLMAFLILALILNGAKTTIKDLISAVLIAIVVRMVIEIADD